MRAVLGDLEEVVPQEVFGPDRRVGVSERVELVDEQHAGMDALDHLGDVLRLPAELVVDVRVGQVQREQAGGWTVGAMR